MTEAIFAECQSSKKPGGQTAAGEASCEAGNRLNEQSMIYTKVGDKVTDIWIDNECYFEEKLIQVHGTVEGRSRLLYISDLKADTEKEVKGVVKASLKKPGHPKAQSQGMSEP